MHSGPKLKDNLPSPELHRHWKSDLKKSRACARATAQEFHRAGRLKEDVETLGWLQKAVILADISIYTVRQ